jgi:hypothetical protein
VNNVRLPVELLDQGERGAGKESKAFVVVLMAVDRTGGKKVRRVDQVSRRSCGIALVNPRGTYLPAPLHGHVFNDLVAEEGAVDLAIERKNNAAINFVLGQGLRQSARDVGESARFRKGHNFR